MSNTATLYFTKFSNWDKQVLTEIGWSHANEPEVLKTRPIAAYQLKDYTNEEYMRIMEIPFKKVLDSYFPNI